MIPDVDPPLRSVRPVDIVHVAPFVLVSDCFQRLAKVSEVDAAPELRNEVGRSREEKREDERAWGLWRRRGARFRAARPCDESTCSCEGRGSVVRLAPVRSLSGEDVPSEMRFRPAEESCACE